MEQHLTNYLLPIVVQRHGGIRLGENLDQNDAIVMSSADALEKSRRADRLFVHKIAQFWYVDTSRASWRRRERESLAHGGNCNTRVFPLDGSYRGP